MDDQAHLRDVKSLNKPSFWQRLKVALAYEGLTPLIVGDSCCMPTLQLANSQAQQDLTHEVVDLSRVNLLIVNGFLTPELKKYLDDLRELIQKRHYVIAMGTCAASGAVFDTPALCEYVKVDAHISGCPPSVDSVMSAIAKLQDQAMSDFLC